MLALAYLGKGDELLTSDCTFSVYAHVAHLVDATVVTTPLKDYAYDLEAMESQITSATKMVMIANPNNPTGTSKNEHELRGFLDVLPDSCCCVIDEAYIEFSSEPSMLKLLEEYPNIVITRTFSKLYGLAAFRIGYGIMRPEVAAVLEKVRQPFNVNSLALEAASIALEKESFLNATLENNRQQMSFMKEQLTKLPCEIVPSDANFLCVRFNQDAGEIVQKLLEKGIIVRHLKSFGLPDAIRVTIGKPDENNAFLKALKESL
jgi:histidinol-phosphate aminotransferase